MTNGFPNSANERRSMIRTSLVCAMLTIAGLFVWAGCRSTPVTGRKQLLLMPESKEVAMGVAAYSDMMKEERPSTNGGYNEMVERVGRRIAGVSGKPDYEWEFKVISSDQQNAFCLPGGKVAIYEGILPVCENEAGLAVVMAHEIAHAIARHGGERMAHSSVSNGVKQAIGVAIQSRDEKQKELVMAAYGAVSKYGAILPYSRKHESEADHIGLVLMAKAGYDPSEAPLFWQRFGQASGGGSPSEFMSTHPSHERRSEELQALVPEAMRHYQTAPNKYGKGSQLQ